MNRAKISSLRGVTVTELVIAFSILLILAPMVNRIFRVFLEGMTSSQARSSMNVESQKALNSISKELGECKRILQSPTADPMVTTIRNSIIASTAPVPIPGSRLPIIQRNKSLSPVVPANFAGPDAGNSLFFVRYRGARDIMVGVSTEFARIDIYTMHYYYVGREPAITIGPTYRRSLWEWASIDYADVTQIRNIPNAVFRDRARDGLLALRINYAWDPTANDPNRFYALTDPLLSTLLSGHPSRANISPLINIMAGLAPGGYRYGVSPNTSAQFSIRQQVPMHNLSWQNLDSPSGFEAMIVGTENGRQIFLRLVLVAQGSFQGISSHEQVVLTSARDIW